MTSVDLAALEHKPWILSVDGLIRLIVTLMGP